MVAIAAFPSQRGTCLGCERPKSRLTPDLTRVHKRQGVVAKGGEGARALAGTLASRATARPCQLTGWWQRECRGGLLSSPMPLTLKGGQVVQKRGNDSARLLTALSLRPTKPNTPDTPSAPDFATSDRSSLIFSSSSLLPVGQYTSSGYDIHPAIWKQLRTVCCYRNNEPLIKVLSVSIARLAGRIPPSIDT